MRTLLTLTEALELEGFSERQMGTQQEVNMASKYPDITVYAVPMGIDEGPEARRIRSMVGCDFIGSGSGSYYSRSCHNAGAWMKVYRHADGTISETNTLRCHRHRAIDERTAANRGWGRDEYEPFDATAAAKRLVREAQAKAQEARLKAISELVAAHADYIVEHVDGLDPETVGSLNAISAMALAGTLVVR